MRSHYSKFGLNFSRGVKKPVSTVTIARYKSFLYREIFLWKFPVIRPISRKSTTIKCPLYSMSTIDEFDIKVHRVGNSKLVFTG